MLKGGERVADFTYPDEQWYYFQMADRFGWLPHQVDELPASLADWLVSIALAVDEVKAEAMNNE